MTSTTSPKRIVWPDNGLYAYLCDILPTYRAPRGGLDIKRIADETGKTRMAIYKWLNRDKLPHAEAAREVFGLAVQSGNVSELNRLGRNPPTLAEIMTKFL